MNVKELVIAVPAMLDAGVVPYILGNQGIGKTQITKNQIAIPNGYKPFYLNFSNMEIGDFLGVQVQGKGADADRSIHLAPAWWPRPDEKMLIICDEINRCKDESLQAAMLTFINEGRIHTHVLPPQSKIVLIGNYEDDARFNVSPLSDLALSQRVCHIDFRPTTQELIAYARQLKTSGADTVADYLMEHPKHSGLDATGKVDLSKKVGDPRSWLDFISRLEEQDLPDNIRMEIYSGLIGPTYAISFMNWKRNRSHRVKGEDVLNSYENVRQKVLELSISEPIRIDILNSILNDIVDALAKNTVLTPSQMQNFKQFLLDLPAELGMGALKTLQETTGWSQRLMILNDIKFVQQFETVKFKSNPNSMVSMFDVFKKKSGTN
jgi:hypothetical protein